MNDYSNYPLMARLLIGQVSSCSCMTKSHEIEVHDALCTYRLLEEARRRLEELGERLPVPAESGNVSAKASCGCTKHCTCDGPL